MAQPAEPKRMANVLIIGTTGSGKSTLANLLVSGEDEPEHGFPVGHGADSKTSGLKSLTSELGACVLQVTDTPGVPDTDRKKSLHHYDEMIKYLRQAPWINAIIIMVAEGRKDERVYRDMRALMKQFNTLPCGKIMVFRSTLPPRCSNERRRQKDRFALEAMDRLCTSAGLPHAMKSVLHDMDDGEVQNLRNLVCRMPAVPLRGLHLRTFSEIRSDFENLSDKNSRMKALEKELERLSALKAAHEAAVEKMTTRLEAQEFLEKGVGVAVKLIASWDPELSHRVSHIVDLSSMLSGTRAGKETAEAGLEEVSKDLTLRQVELVEGRVNLDDLEKAKAEFEELDILGRD